MTLDDLKASPAFVTLNSDQQRQWVLAYCSNGADALEATRTAYPSTKDEAGLVAIANRNKRHPAIKRLISDFYGQTDETGTRDEFLAILWKKVRDTTDDKAKLGWATIYMKVKGYETKATPEPPKADEEESIDDLVRQMEEKAKS